MSNFIDPHVPTEEFRTHLEWEVVRSLRRESAPTRSIARPQWRRLRAAAIVLIALVAGAAAGAGSAQVQDSRQRGELLAAERSELELANLRVELARAAVDKVRERYQSGVAGRESLAAAEAELQAMESNLAKIRLNLEEIQATALPPRDNLSAPLVGERDYVRSRLALELAAAQERLALVEQTVARTQQAHDVGAMPRLALLERQTELARARADLALLAEKLELRQEFVEDRVEAEVIARQLHRAEMQQELAVVQQLRALAEQRLALIRDRRDAGTVEEVDVLRVQLELAERQAELQRIQSNLEALQNSQR